MDGDSTDEEEICLFFEGENSRRVEVSPGLVRVKLIQNPDVSRVQGAGM